MRLPTIMLAAVFPAAAMAQNQPQTQQPQAQQGEAQADNQQQQQDCNQQAQANQQGKQKRPSMAHDVGNAAATGGSQIAGAAVAGPIGAAVAPVVVNHVGHAVKHAIKGKKKKDGPQQELQAQCAPSQQ